MSRASVADFVDSFFTRTLFQADDTLAASVLDTDLSPDVEIVINGTRFTKATFVTLITEQFRSTFVASVTEIKDLNILTTNDAGSTGVVAQWTSYVTKGKDDGKDIKQSATTVVRVEEIDGKHVVTGLWEAQTSE
ncbi:uncharacterized protein BHQ10_006514 [Talaromyces amestolkiae]|uniref:SnoaL-like domain-containing protein n=1 Tax=Talaromyces amestolkiae TaxID=1196081 RepID=A0A364L3X5_TALAM|nr:uncharacterized protein BHQ10_006514 [Talaromyces amestolkiae]RAO70502.1 hypothetical protein BHQ10_006514 [Talaromyces amestolkiae]